jgi:hypothetical protein
MELTILSYPDEEALRLEKVALALPIDADGPMVDNKPERLPKQISRHLLPSSPDRRSRHLLDNSIAALVEPPRHRRSSVSPPLSRQGSSTTKPVDIPGPPPLRNQPPKPIERERMPYAGTPSASEHDRDRNPSPNPPFPHLTHATSNPIERERQPYAAQPGSGRVFENKNPASNSSSGAYPYQASSSKQARERANSAGRSARDRDDGSASSRQARERANSAGRSMRDRDDGANMGYHRSGGTAYMPPPRYPPSGAGIRRTGSPPLKGFSTSTPGSLDSGIGYPGGFAAGSYGSAGNGGFGGIPERGDRDRDREQDRDREREKRIAREFSRERDRRVKEEEEARLAGLFSSPRDTERWDRLTDEYHRGGSKRY